MPVIRSADIAVHQVHGSTFSSFVAPSRGSTQLCAWQLRVPAGLTGAAHRPPEKRCCSCSTGNSPSPSMA